MTVFSDIKKIETELCGDYMSLSQAIKLRNKLGVKLFPQWLESVFRSFKLSKTCFTIKKKDDLSGLGAELFWLSPDQILEEAFMMQPGIAVVQKGFIPVGGCLIGTGDPYFLKMEYTTSLETTLLVRIPHDFVYSEVDAIENVCYLKDFF